MIIKTLKDSYKVIVKIGSTSYGNIYVCSKEDESCKEQYRILEINDSILIHKLISVFKEQEKNKVFEDFYNCFSKNGCLYLVFRNEEYVPLAKMISDENCNLKEKIEIGKEILEKILLFNIPYFILSDILKVENITISLSHKIGFVYNLNSIEDFEQIGMSQICIKLKEMFLLIFYEEVKKQKCPDINEFIESLTCTGYTDLYDIYKAYEILYQKINRLDDVEINKLKPNTFCFRWWNKTKKVFVKFKWVLVLFFTAVIVITIFNTVIAKFKTNELTYPYEQIGTVKIQNSSEK